MRQQTPAARHITRLVRLFQIFEQRRSLHARFNELLDDLDKRGYVVVGEQLLLQDLSELLGRTQDKLRALEQSPDTSAATRHIDEIAEMLASVKWEVADEAIATLEQSKDALDAIRQQYEDKLRDLESTISNLNNRIASGRLASAPILKEESDLQRIQQQVTRALRTLRDESLLLENGEDSEAYAEELKALADAISEKELSVKDFARQADLLLLQSPLVDERYFTYTVMLHTPSEPGSHGVNVQDTSTLVWQDRRMMSEAINQVTDAINSGLLRQFIRQGASGTAPPLASGLSSEPIRHLSPTATGLSGESGLDANELVQEVGDMMYRLFMPEQMQSYIRQTPCSLTITTNDLELPWELMWHQGEFLCLNRPVARMPMGHTFPRSHRPSVRKGSKLRFLLIYSDPGNTLPAAKKEIERIQAYLQQDWSERVDITVLDRQEATGAKLNELLLAGSFDVIHYAGHAAFEEDDPDLSGLLLAEKEVYFAQKIRRLLEGRPLVFLNACQSGRSANEDEPQQVGPYLPKPAEGLASAFIYGGALGCIGSLWPIYDEPAADFAVELYNKVLEGYMIGQAMQLARQHIRDKYTGGITWAAFVLYGNPTFRLLA